MFTLQPPPRPSSSTMKASTVSVNVFVHDVQWFHQSSSSSAADTHDAMSRDPCHQVIGAVFVYLEDDRSCIKLTENTVFEGMQQSLEISPPTALSAGRKVEKLESKVPSLTRHILQCVYPNHTCSLIRIWPISSFEYSVVCKSVLSGIPACESWSAISCVKTNYGKQRLKSQNKEKRVWIGEKSNPNLSANVRIYIPR